MTDAQALQFLLTAAATKPNARLSTTVNRMRVLQRAEELKHALSIERQAERLMEMAGCSEGIC
jgi:hypothetical protein